MESISQSELDKIFAGCREKASPGFSKPPAPQFHKNSTPCGGKSPDIPCIITQDELDRVLPQNKQP
ncbi:MAG: hypothetical protein LBG07_04080 [Treponema sp.]|jgi:hypothetical protein|nr:hypothetical protein [Treponema sp.]